MRPATLVRKNAYLLEGNLVQVKADVGQSSCQPGK